jgi:predicted cobalt transporter CbtA
MLGVPQGLGKHLAVIQMDKAAYRQLLKIQEIHMCCVTIGLSIVKISVSFLYLRLTTTRAYRGFLWGVIGFMVAFAIASAGTLVC